MRMSRHICHCSRTVLPTMQNTEQFRYIWSSIEAIYWLSVIIIHLESTTSYSISPTLLGKYLLNNATRWGQSSAYIKVALVGGGFDPMSFEPWFPPWAHQRIRGIASPSRWGFIYRDPTPTTGREGLWLWYCCWAFGRSGRMVGLAINRTQSRTNSLYDLVLREQNKQITSPFHAPSKRGFHSVQKYPRF